jgi:hypothetical protein
MYHKEGDFLDRSVADHFPPGGVGNLPGTQNEHVRAAKLFFNAPFLSGEHLEMNAQGFGDFDIFPVQAIHAAY